MQLEGKEIKPASGRGSFPVPKIIKKKNVPVQSVGINPKDRGGETHLYAILPNV